MEKNCGPERQRVCGNCGHSVLFKGAESISKDFKCSLGMKWVQFDLSCKSHFYLNEDVTPIPEVMIPTKILEMSAQDVKET
jgi:hypothetical protein